MDMQGSSQLPADYHGDIRQSIESEQHLDQNQEQETSTGAGANHVEDDGESLFIPEFPTQPTQMTSQSGLTINMPPPSRPAPTSSQKSVSNFAKIREMQRRIQEKRNAARRNEVNYPPDRREHVMYPEEVIPESSSSSTAPGDQDERADKRAREKFEELKRRYDDLTKKNHGSLSFRHHIEWMRIQGDEDARRKKRQRDLALAQQEDDEKETILFPLDLPADNAHNDIDESDDEYDGSHKRRRQDLSRKQPPPMSMQDAELQSMQVALSATRDKGKKKKSPSQDDDPQASQSSDKGEGKGKGKAKAKTKDKKVKTMPKSKAGPSKVTKNGNSGRESAKKKREKQCSLNQLSSLIGSDVFNEQAARGAREQPNFTSKIKGTALKQIIAAIPLDQQKASRSDINLLLQATKDFDGRGAVKSDGCGLWLVKGMKTSLKSYQVLGTSFMRRRENGVHEPKGGLLADQMGLGKTLMMLANIVNGQPTKGAEGPKTTLLVASPVLLSQWKGEIERHTNCNFKLIRYGAGTRIDSNRSIEILGSHDIVLTTYHEIMKSYPKNEPPVHLQTAAEKIEWWQKEFEMHRGVLHRMIFLRVVLDEAQAIKNHMGRTSIACRALMARHKWALSGTPISNSLTELYPYFKFLGVPYTGNFQIFKHNYCSNKPTINTERLLVQLSGFMLRRTHADEMFGAPILKLPQADQITYWCEFNSVERQIYDVVEKRFAQRIAAMREGGTIEKSYNNVLVMLLRLRQLTAHVLMLQFVMEELLEREDIELLKDIVQKQVVDNSSQSGRVIIAIRKQLDTLALEEQKRTAAAARAARAAKAAGRQKDDDDVNDKSDDNVLWDEELYHMTQDDESMEDLTQQEMNGHGPSGRRFGKEFNFKPFLQSLKTGDSWEKTKAKSRCSQCDKQPKRPVIMSCGHLICSNPCRMDADNIAAEAGQELASCRICKKVPHYYHSCDLDDERDTPEAVSRGTRSHKAWQREQRKRGEDDDFSKDWLESIADECLPSAKTIAVKAQIINWIKENPDVKILIYTQFLAMIRILARICEIEGWRTEQYHGKMSFVARDKAIGSFAENPESKILLATMRSGGLGLNLTMASKVIVIDPWWNSAAEQQAFCRVFRIGQKEETSMSRLCVKHTVDHRLINMQRRKKKEIDSVMEGDKNRVKKLNIYDLTKLFGGLERDSDDENSEEEEEAPFIVVENADLRGGFLADGDHEGYADEL